MKIKFLLPAFVALGMLAPAGASADMTCLGAWAKPAKGELSETESGYRFGCSDIVKSFALFTSDKFDIFGDAADVFDASLTPIGTEGFVCAGGFPGRTLSCGVTAATKVGTSSGHVVMGRLGWMTDPCVARDVPPDMKLVVTGGDYHVYGPFNLRRPKGCFTRK